MLFARTGVHERSTCHFKKEKPCKEQDCKANHHFTLHGSTNSKVMVIKTCSSSETEQDDTLVTGILPMIHYIFKDVNQGTTIFMDEGSNTSLITMKLANALYLQGKVKLTTVLKACDKVSQAISHVHHEVKLEDHQGKKYRINCIEVPFITEIQDLPNLKKIYEMFPSIPKGCLNNYHISW